MAVTAAVGQVSAETIRARNPEPPQDRAAMDGYAVRLGGVAGGSQFRLLPGLAAAGRPTGPLGPGEAIAITTGTPVPVGTDGVVRKERALVQGNRLRLRVPLTRGSDVHERGEDLRRGTTIVRRGERITPYQIALLVAQGVRTVRVRSVRILFLPVGDEVKDRPHRGRGEVSDSITPLISVLAPGAVCSSLPAVPDDPGAIGRSIRRAAKSSDLVVTVGGTSVGPKDFTKPVVGSLGTLLFDGVRVNILKRAAVGLVGGTPVMLLPGQVVAAVTAWHEHGLRLLARRQGVARPPWRPVRLERGLVNRHPMDSVYLFRVHHGSARPCRWGVRLYSELLRANAWGIVPRQASLRAGTVLRVQPFVGAW